MVLGKGKRLPNTPCVQTIVFSFKSLIIIQFNYSSTQIHSSTSDIRLNPLNLTPSIVFKYVIHSGFKNQQQIGYRIQQANFFIATIGERGVMKTKIFGLALMLSMAALLGACEGANDPTTPTTPAATGEPTDTGTTPAATPASP